jgi:hypothetical protein
LEFSFENLVPVLFVVIAITRVLSAVRRRGKRDSGEDAPPPPARQPEKPVLNPAGTDFIPHWETEEAVRPAAARTKARKETPRLAPLAAESAAAGDIPARASGTGREPVNSSPEFRPRTAFPGNLEYLPSLKRAVVLAEILGKPRGLTD